MTRIFANFSPLFAKNGLSGFASRRFEVRVIARLWLQYALSGGPLTVELLCDRANKSGIVVT